MMRDAFTLQECANADEMLIEEIEVPEGFRELIMEPLRRELTLRMQNAEDLRSIQKVISLEEKKEPTLEEVLARVLSFYSRFVPYK